MTEANEADGRDKALDRARDHFDSGAFKADLARRIAIPTESQEPSMRPELARYLADEMAPWLAARGFRSTISDNPDPGGGPFLVAERQEGAGLPTLLTYGHGDVVRGIPEQWRDGLDPWRLIEDGERWYGRGTADNKGQHSIVLAALASVIEERGALGFNAKILIETGEEIGSPGLESFVAEQKGALAANVFLASDGPRVRSDAPSVMLGNRGGISFDLVVSLREGSRHSGHWGGILEDPGLILAHALASIADKHGRIRVNDWLPKAIPARIREAMHGLEVDPSGDAEPMPTNWGEPGLTQAEKMFAWTGFIVLAFITGRPENPVNGVQPDATARCQIRFSADVDEEDLLPALRRHLDAEGFEQVAIRPSGHVGFPAWRTDPENPWVDWTLSSARRTLDREPVLVPNSSGGLPSAIFARNLDVPVIWIPHSYSGCCQHGPNEHLLTPQTREGLELMTGLFWDLGVATPTGRSA